MTRPGRGALKALLVDDHPLVLNALTTALTSLQTFDCIDRELNLSQAMEQLERTSDYDLILLDLHMSDAAGAEAVVRLREAHPDMPVVIFSGDESVETIHAAFDHGVLGYIPKRTPVPQIINAIKVVLEGGSYIPPDFMRALGFEPPETRRRSKPPEPAVPTLTPRQEQVFAYLLQGMPNKVIADRLGMAEGTVKAHLFTIYRLFGASSRAQVILKASQLGLV
jgi:DNA-binding NarL/FixJ family response regulator